jgi:hypothetical protein
LENVAIFYGHLEYFGYLGYSMTIRNILCSFDTFFPVLVSRTKKNLATLARLRKKLKNSPAKDRCHLGSVFLTNN